MEAWDSKPPRMKGGIVIGLAVLVGLLGLWDLSRFWLATETYTRAAIQGPRVLPPPIAEEAIVVLTGAEKRIPRAIELLKSRSAPLLIISGTGKNTTLTDLANSQGDAIFNIQEVWSRIIMESRSSSTRENVEESGKLLEQRNVSRVIVVTTDYHCPRAAALFKKQLPKYEYVFYPVASLHELSFDALAKWLAEYGKYFFFRIVDKL